MALHAPNNNQPTRRPGVVLAVCLAVALVCTVVYSREGENGPLHSVQGMFSMVSTPVNYVGSAVGTVTTSTLDSIENMTADESTLQGLREQNEQLRRMLAQTEEYRQEVERLRGLLNLKNSSAVDGVTARVIGRSGEAWNQTVTIDVGTGSGVDVGMTVMGSSGVVGQIIQTSPTTATVRLLTDPQSGAAVMVQSNRAAGVVRGSLEGILYLENLETNAVVNIGDVVVTSGLGGSYTSGLIVGTVVSIDQRQGEVAKRIVVSPNDTAAPLQEVLVVTGVGQSSSSNSSDSSSASSTSSDSTSTNKAGE